MENPDPVDFTPKAYERYRQSVQAIDMQGLPMLPWEELNSYHQMLWDVLVGMTGTAALHGRAAPLLSALHWVVDQTLDPLPTERPLETQNPL